ncbi:Uncharacterised protein [Raoultella planticola]|uniref:Uncharacterized protein n=1 Tax=Raoultella planticola TaxID=575 RepID=A0A485BYQ4_RAOPL|nr:Uncharacterised protein [Raoultella planticola]
MAQGCASGSGHHETGQSGYKPGDTIKLHIAAPAAGKGYAMVESSEGPLWWQEIDVRRRAWRYRFRSIKPGTVTISTSAPW